ncbi:hypothetical protein [Sphingomonas sp. 28-63-12]|uniref:hypothetical protein n=1 Tax=Sphingomonas sp. 28-63-12 TaxID=1970434 RepID=UPI000BC703B7|nr:MAG: hypothetical protein B7Y47_03250 [Sphingomonas sp. 28-63-12]
MINGILALFVLLPQVAPAAPEPDDIVVTAAPQGGCRVQFADKTLSDAEFRERARIWAAGAPVRVIARSDASFDCFKKIAFQLANWGVKQIAFVEPSGRQTAVGFPQPKLTGDRPTKRGSDKADKADKADRADGADEIDATSARTFAAPTKENGRSIAEIEQRLLSAHAAQLILDGKCTEARRLMLENGNLAAAAQVVEICRAN